MLWLRHFCSLEVTTDMWFFVRFSCSACRITHNKWSRDHLNQSYVPDCGWLLVFAPIRMHQVMMIIRRFFCTYIYCWFYWIVPGWLQKRKPNNFETIVTKMVYINLIVSNSWVHECTVLKHKRFADIFGWYKNVPQNTSFSACSIHVRYCRLKRDTGITKTTSQYKIKYLPLIALMLVFLHDVEFSWNRRVSPNSRSVIHKHYGSIDFVI